MSQTNTNSKRIRFTPKFNVWLILGFVLILLGGANQLSFADEGDVILYGANRDDGSIVEINLTQGTAQAVGTLAFGTVAIEQDPATGYVYHYEASSSGDQFAYWDPATGNNTIVRTYNPSPGFNMHRMAFRADGTLFIMDSNQRVHRIDKSTGDITTLGTSGGLNPGWAGDLAFSPSNTPYLVTDRNLYTISATLQTTLLYSNMIPNNADIVVWSGLAYCDGLLYASHIASNATQTNGVSSMYSINPSSGQVTELFSLPIVVNDLTMCSTATSSGNTPPVADDQSVTTDQDTPVPITLTASDANGDPLTYSVASGPSNGTLSGSAPNLTYTPNAGYSGSDSFTFTANDGTINSNTATVSITVNQAANIPPVANDQSVTTDQDTPVAITLTASDVDGDPLTYSTVSGPSNGTLSGSAPNLTYTPNAGYSGSDSFTFIANDGSADSNTATVSITVNQAANTPPVANGQSVTTDQDTPVAITLTASDANGDPLTYSVASGPSNGTLSGSAPNLTYTPNAGYSGSDSFTFIANDGTADSNAAIVSIVVNSAANTPPVANDQSVTTVENTPVAITLTASDVDGDPLTYNTVSGPSNGTLSGSAPNLTYTPNSGYSGSDSFTFNANDGSADSNTATVSITVNPENNTAPVANGQSVTTNEDAPVSITLTASDVDGDPLTYLYANTCGTPTRIMPMGDSITAGSSSGVSNSTQWISYRKDLWDSLQAAGYNVDFVGNQVSGQFYAGFDPDHQGHPGQNAAWVAQNVYAMLTTSSPVDIVLLHIGTNGRGDSDPGDIEDILDQIDLYESNFNQEVTVVLARIINRSVFHQITADFNNNVAAMAQTRINNDGDDIVIVNMENGAGINYNTQPVGDMWDNLHPYAPGYSKMAQVWFNALESLLVSPCPDLTAPAHGTLSGSPPNLTYTPNAGYSGPDSFTFRANDGIVDSNTATISITINPAPNTPPVANNQNASTAQDTPAPIVLTASDADGDPLTYNTLSGPSNGTLSGSAPNLTYTPNSGYSGPDSFTFRSNDGTANSNTATVSITVSSSSGSQDTILYGGNRDTAEIVEINLTQGTAQVVGTMAFGTTAMERDPETGYVYYFEKFTTGDQFAYWDPATGNNTIVRTYNPAPGIYVKRMAFHPNGTLYAMDDQDRVHVINKQNGNITSLGKVSGLVTGSLNGTGDMVFNTSGTPYVVTYENLYSIQYPQSTLLYANMLDIQNDIVTWSGLAYCDGTFYASHIDSNEAQTVASSAMYHININTGQVTKLFDLPTYINDLTACATTGSSNAAPVANNQSVTTVEDTPVAITLTASDADGDPLTYNIVSGPSNGTLSGSAPNVTYTPNAGHTGSDSFTFRANDGTINSNTATVSITVNPAANVPPVANNQSVSTEQNTPVAITLIASDSNGDPLTYNIVSGPSNGSLSGSAPNVTYTPNSGYTGSDSFTFTANDGTADSNTATVSISVSGPQDTIIYASNREGELIEVNLTQGAAQIVGTLAFGTQAMEQDPATGYVYYFEDSYDTSGNEFAYWDPATGNNTIVRTYNPAPGFYAKRLAFHPNGTLYLMDDSERVYRIDKLTGDITSIGPITGVNTGWYTGTGDMAFSPNGTVYMMTYRNLYTIQYPQATLLYDNMLQGTTFSLVWTGVAYCDGLLYASHVAANQEQTIGESAMYSIDPATGEVIELFSLPNYVNDLTSCPANISN